MSPFSFLIKQFDTITQLRYTFDFKLNYPVTKVRKLLQATEFDIYWLYKNSEKESCLQKVWEDFQSRISLVSLGEFWNPSVNRCQIDFSLWGSFYGWHLSHNFSPFSFEDKRIPMGIRFDKKHLIVSRSGYVSRSSNSAAFLENSLRGVKSVIKFLKIFGIFFPKEQRFLLPLPLNPAPYL